MLLRDQSVFLPPYRFLTTCYSVRVLLLRRNCSAGQLQHLRQSRLRLSCFLLENVGKTWWDYGVVLALIYRGVSMEMNDINTSPQSLNNTFDLAHNRFGLSSPQAQTDERNFSSSNIFTPFLGNQQQQQGNRFSFSKVARAHHDVQTNRVRFPVRQIPSITIDARWPTWKTFRQLPNLDPKVHADQFHFLFSKEISHDENKTKR